MNNKTQPKEEVKLVEDEQLVDTPNNQQMPTAVQAAPEDVPQNTEEGISDLQLDNNQPDTQVPAESNIKEPAVDDDNQVDTENSEIPESEPVETTIQPATFTPPVAGMIPTGWKSVSDVASYATEDGNFVAPATGLEPTGWAYPEDTAESVAMTTGDAPIAAESVPEVVPQTLTQSEENPNDNDNSMEESLTEKVEDEESSVKQDWDSSSDEDEKKLFDTWKSLIAQNNPEINTDQLDEMLYEIVPYSVHYEDDYNNLLSYDLDQLVAFIKDYSDNKDFEDGDSDSWYEIVNSIKPIEPVVEDNSNDSPITIGSTSDDDLKSVSHIKLNEPGEASEDHSDDLGDLEGVINSLGGSNEVSSNLRKSANIIDSIFDGLDDTSDDLNTEDEEDNSFEAEDTDYDDIYEDDDNSEESDDFEDDDSLKESMYHKNRRPLRETDQDYELPHYSTGRDPGSLYDDYYYMGYDKFTDENTSSIVSDFLDNLNGEEPDEDNIETAAYEAWDDDYLFEDDDDYIDDAEEAFAEGYARALSDALDTYEASNDEDNYSDEDDEDDSENLDNPEFEDDSDFDEDDNDFDESIKHSRHSLREQYDNVDGIKWPAQDQNEPAYSNRSKINSSRNFIESNERKASERRAALNKFRKNRVNENIVTYADIDEEDDKLGPAGKPVSTVINKETPAVGKKLENNRRNYNPKFREALQGTNKYYEDLEETNLQESQNNWNRNKFVDKFQESSKLDFNELIKKGFLG